MPIFDQGYQHWNGQLSGHAWRWLTVTREGVRAQLKKRGTRWTLLVAFAPALVLASVLIVWGLLEQGSTILEPIMPLLQGLPEEIRNGPKAYRGAFWTMAYDIFFRVQAFFMMVLVAVVGPDLISQDLRFNAMPLYLSRPLRRIDYFLGKLGVIGFFLGVVAIVPAVAAYLLGFAFSFELSVLRDTGRLLLGSIGYGLLVVLSAGTLVLALSSLSRSSRLVGALWIGFWLVSGMTAQVLEESVRQKWCPVVSYAQDIGRVREALLGTVAARDQFVGLIKRTREAAAAAARSVSPFGRMMGGPRRGGFGPPPPPPPPDGPGVMEFGPGDDRPPGFEPGDVPRILQLQADRYPWTWSAGVLLGLFLISALILSTRVKTLDRLK